MIKELIEDITFDRITLSQALTRAKIIAYKINNAQFKDWISSELNGYSDYKDLPSYRILPCDIFAEVNNPYIGVSLMPFDVSLLDKYFKAEGTFDSSLSLYNVNIVQSISIIEDNCLGNDEFYAFEEIPQELVRSLRAMVRNQGELISVKRRIQISQLKHIIYSTKQRLLDTLLDLNEAFPNLENEYKNNSHNETIAKTIINQNIYGDYANSNIGVGENINQSIIDENDLNRLIDEIKDLGIDDSDANEVKEIVLHEKKENVGRKLFNWFGRMSTKALEKGIEIKIPRL